MMVRALLLAGLAAAIPAYGVADRAGGEAPSTLAQPAVMGDERWSCHAPAYGWRPGALQFADASARFGGERSRYPAPPASPCALA